MSFECMAWAIKQRAGGVAAKSVLMHLANCTNHQTGVCRPRIKTIAEECEISESTVKRALVQLSDAGLIEVVKRFKEGVQLANDYTLIMEGVGSGRTQGGFKLNPGVGSNLTPIETGSIETGIEPDKYHDAATGAAVTVGEAQSTGTITAVTGTALTPPEAQSSEAQTKPLRKRRSPTPQHIPRTPPPSQEELSEYMKSTWSWIPALEYEKCHAYHESRGWLDNRGKPWKDWRAVAKTWATNWKSFNQEKYMEIIRAEQTKARNAAASQARALPLPDVF